VGRAWKALGRVERERGTYWDSATLCWNAVGMRMRESSEEKERKSRKGRERLLTRFPFIASTTPQIDLRLFAEWREAA
jgi:hypothetical protein